MTFAVDWALNNNDLSIYLSQVVEMVHDHEKREAWLKEQSIKRYLYPHYLLMHGDSKTFVVLALFLFTQIFIQLTFKGYFKYLVPHMPEFIQSMLK